MRRIGPLFLAAAVFLAAAAASPVAFSGAGSSGGPFHLKYFGENPKQPHTTTPDDANFQEACAVVGVCAPAPAGDAPKDGAAGAGAPSQVVPQVAPERPPIPGAAPDIPKPASPGPQAVPAPVPGAVPSPRPRPAASVFTPAKEPSAPEEALRDAPAPVNPNQYSLWSLSRPLLLPAAKIREVSADQARTMGREDYERHVLGLAGGQDATAVDRRPADPGELVSQTTGGASEDKGRPVILEMDVAATPGEFRDAVAELADAAGFQMDDRFEPLFLGADKTRVTVRGWLPPQRISDAMASPRVTRMESVGASDRAAADPAGTWTELLLGVRIPPESSPAEALHQAVGRISARMDFDFRKAIGYQKIPGTNRMVFIVSGRVRVRDIGRLMGDPDIVKIAPSPSEPESRRAVGSAAAPASPLLRFVRFSIDDHPFLFLLSLLLTVSLMGSALRRRGGTRSSSKSRPKA